ncbi:MAG: hypothetical protein IJM62_06780 [Lachnospiraceae bacterium]|nr:hypothetical protein [Lachnospiraceae bacterium]
MEKEHKTADSTNKRPAAKGLFIGASGIDAVFMLDRPLPSENEKIKTNSFYLDTGGPAAKAAEVFAGLGGDASLVTCIGDSPLGGFLKASLEAAGVKVKDIAGDAYTTPNVSSVLIRQENGTRTLVSGQKPLDGAVLGDTVSGDFDFCLYDCNLPDLTPEIVEALRIHKIPLVLDCGSWKPNIECALEYADIAISSSGFISPDGSDIFALQEKYGIRLVSRTNDGGPVEFCENGLRGTVPVNKLDSGNTLGAGDVFHGAFCFFCFSEGAGFPEALSRAALYTEEYIKARPM